MTLPVTKLVEDDGAQSSKREVDGDRRERVIRIEKRSVGCGFHPSSAGREISHTHSREGLGGKVTFLSSLVGAVIPFGKENIL